MSPGNTSIKLNKARLLIEQGKLREAELIYRHLIKDGSKNHTAFVNLGAILKTRGDCRNAIWFLRKSLEIRNTSEAHNNLGNAFQDLGCLNSAIESYESALKLKPNCSDTHNNLGNAFLNQGNLTAAINSCNSAIKLNPNHVEAHINLSISLLLSGDYQNGWMEYEWRAKSKDYMSLPHASPNCKIWAGQSISDENRLLLVTEQGLGDILQFIRYANALRDQGLTVSICAQPRLHSLIKASNLDFHPFTPEQATNFQDGLWSPLLSVPKHLNVSPNNPIITQPYISSTKELNDKWKRLLSKHNKPVIGINWRGNRDKPSKKTRNIPIDSFVPILKDVDAVFIPLQRDASRSEINLLKRIAMTNTSLFNILRIVDSDTSEDFLELAAIISNCDLIITTGSTIAHLSAAIGIPTWVLLPKVPDWRWGLEGESCFWYPSMRLFRQNEINQWQDVLHCVSLELQDCF